MQDRRYTICQPRYGADAGKETQQHLHAHSTGTSCFYADTERRLLFFTKFSAGLQSFGTLQIGSR